MKNVLIILVSILIIAFLFKLLEIENKKAINDCMNAGHSQTYCEYHAN